MASPATKPALDPIDVLQKVADGLTLLEIAAEHGFHYHSVKNLMRLHYDRTGATGLSHAVAQAFRGGKIQ